MLMCPPVCLTTVDYQFGTPESDYASATGAGGKVVIVGDTGRALGGSNHGSYDLFIVKLRP